MLFLSAKPEDVRQVRLRKRPQRAADDEAGEQTPSSSDKDYVCVKKIRRCSSVVEHVIGNDGVVSPILISGTSNKKKSTRSGALFFTLYRWQERAYERLRQQSGSPESTSPSEFCEAAEMS